MRNLRSSFRFRSDSLHRSATLASCIANRGNIRNACDVLCCSRILGNRVNRRGPAALFSLLFVFLSAHAQSPRSDAASFVVGDIRIEGLQRVSEGTVYNYLPVNIGDQLDARRVQEAVRALYATGFFQEVELRRDQGALLIAVRERPSIEKFEIKGNKDIKTEDLQRSLRNVGLAPGKTFDRSVLDDVKQYLTEQYFSRGKYAASIDTRVEELPNNNVAIAIDIKEGQRARIRQINIVGNKAFPEKELLAQLELRTPNWLSWYQQDDRYGKEVLTGDLETLRSYYMDRGYANFEVTSTQVAIAEEKRDIFITINVDEGETFAISEVKFAGDLVVPESELRRLVAVTPGSIYSQKLITQTAEAIKLRLGLDGYAFAKVDPVHSSGPDEQQLALTMVVDPGSRVYVRRINFGGTSAVNDVVLRREMRQLEGAYLSNLAVERSKQRIQRLPFIEDVEVETTPVPGTPDLVDVDFKIKDGLPGQFGGGIGYSDSQSIILSANAIHTNFMGTGERLAFDASGGSYRELYRISHTDPYITMDGVSRTVNLSYSEVSQLTSSYSDFSTQTYLTGIEFSYPITERQRIAFGSSIQHAELVTSLSSSEQLQDWVRDNGDSFFERHGDTFILGTKADIVEVSAGWSFDSRDRLLFPTSGSTHRFDLVSAIPDSPIEYLAASYQYQQLLTLPIPQVLPSVRSLTFSLDTRLSYATAFGDTTAVPPNRHYFTGGPDSVRGFQEHTLGPRDSLGNPYGGDAALYGQLEAIMPMPEKFAGSARLSLFFDFGNSFHLGDTKFTNKTGGRADYGFDLRELRTSAGIAVQWLAPLGLFRFSYAQPLRYQNETRKEFGDEIERFQFSIGNAF
jgi:outer membrane protein insertion porin family